MFRVVGSSDHQSHGTLQIIKSFFHSLRKCKNQSSSQRVWSMGPVRCGGQVIWQKSGQEWQWVSTQESGSEKLYRPWQSDGSLSLTRLCHCATSYLWKKWRESSYVVTVKLQGRMWIISSACTGVPQLQMVTVTFDWILQKHESKPVLNPPRWGHYLSYGVVGPNLAAVAKRTRFSSNSIPPSLLLVLFCCAVINKDIYNQSFLTERSLPATSWISWTLYSLAVSLVRVQLDWTLHKANALCSLT